MNTASSNVGGGHTPRVASELSRTVHVLAVDDKSANLLSLQQLLHAPDLQLVTADSGAEALKKLLHHQFCCILLDIRMPGMDGFEVARIIRQDPELASTPIIFVTAEAHDQEEQFLGYEHGAVDFLIKPLVPEVLRAKVEVFANLHRQRRALDQSRLVEELYGRLSSANEQLRRYTFIASHDLREPLRRIQCLVDLLDLELGDHQDSSVQTLAQDLKQSAGEMQVMVDTFRELSEVLGAATELERLDLTAIVREALSSFETQLAARAHQLEIGPLPKVMGSRKLLLQLFRILFDNALVHGRGDPLRLKVQALPARESWELRIFNSAVQIPESQLHLIFEPLVRGGILPKIQHPGMGLTRARSIVELHKGRIWAESTADGVSLCLTLKGEGL